MIECGARTRPERQWKEPVPARSLGVCAGRCREILVQSLAPEIQHKWQSATDPTPTEVPDVTVAPLNLVLKLNGV